MRKFVSFGCCCQCYIISTWCAVEICAKGAIFVTLKNIIRSWFQSEEEHRLCQRKVTVNSRTTPTPWRECLGARSKWTQMLCNFAYEQSGSSDWSLFTWVERDTESELSIRLELIHMGGEGHWEWIVHQTGAYLPGWRGTLRVNCPVQEHSAQCPRPGLEPGVVHANHKVAAPLCLSRTLCTKVVLS